LPNKSKALVLPATPPVAQADGSFQASLGFLAGFPCSDDIQKVPEIPAAIKALDGSRVRIHGFMLPIDIEGTQTRLFALMRSQLSCCYGAVPKLNEWALVRMPPGETASLRLMDNLIEVEGTLTMGSTTDQQEVYSLYRLAATRVEKVQK
jgi:hypothetical protein